MKFSSNFNLNLPDLDDKADITKLNENFEKIDELIKENESDPALEAKVEEINNKIGTESDADTQPTLFGRLAQLKNALLEKLAEVLTKVTGIDGKIGTSGDTAGIDTVFGKIADNSNSLSGISSSVEEIKRTIPTGIVKSVQRGHISLQGNTNYKDISITPVAMEKSFIIVSSGTMNGKTETIGMGCESYFKNESEITIERGNSNSSSNSGGVSWQVIEFY